MGIFSNPFKNKEDVLTQEALSTKESGIRLRNAGVRDAKNTVNLSIGISYLPMVLSDEDMTRAYAEALEKKLFEPYSAVSGLPEFKEAVQKRSTGLYGSDFDDVGVLPMNGSQQSMLAVALGFVDPKSKKDEVLVPTPNFPNASGSFELTGRNVKYIQAPKENGFMPTGDWIRKNYTEGKTKVLVITIPNNPAGGSTTKEQAEDIAKAINEIMEKDKNFVVVFDNAYAGMEAKEAESPLKYLSKEAKNRTLISETYSKQFASANQRLGWLTGHPDLLKDLEGIMAKTTNNIQGFAQLCAVKAMEKLERNPEISEAIANEYEYRISYLNKSIDEIKGKIGLEVAEDKLLPGGMFAFKVSPLNDLRIPSAISNAKSPIDKEKPVGTDGFIKNSIDVADVLAYASNINVPNLTALLKDVVVVEGDGFNMTKDKDGVGNPDMFIRMAANRDPIQLAQATLAMWVVAEQSKAEQQALESNQNTDLSKVTISSDKVTEMNRWYEEQVQKENDRQANEIAPKIEASKDKPELHDFLKRLYDNDYRQQQREETLSKLEQAFDNKVQENIEKPRTTRVGDMIRPYNKIIAISVDEVGKLLGVRQH